MSLNNDFRTNRRTYNERGGFFGQYTGLDSLYPSAGVYSINTSSHILSAGVNLLNIFAAAGSTGGSVYTTVNTTSASWSSVYTTVNTTSASWSSVYTTVGTTSASWSSVYSTVGTTSASWSSVYSSYNTASANLVNSITSPSTQGIIEYTKLGGGGTQTANLFNLGTTGSPTFSNINIANNATITGNLSVLGDLTFLNTNVSTTSALSVVNAGTGPALLVKQGGTQPIAYFVDADGTGDIIFADNGNVGLGVGTYNPAERLTVSGKISSNNIASLSGAILRHMNQTSVTTGNKYVTVEADGTLTYDAIPTNTSNVEGIGLITNRLTKSSSTATTLTASTIVDTGSSVQIDRNVSFIQSAPDSLSPAGADSSIVRQVFTGLVATNGTQLSTFPLSLTFAGAVQNLMYSRYNILLYNTSTGRTAYEVIAVNTTTAGVVSGSIFGIIDSQATSLLYDTDIINNGYGPLILSLSSTSACRSVIEGIGYYALQI